MTSIKPQNNKKVVELNKIVTNSINDLMKNLNSWEGTMTQLKAKLESLASNSDMFPKSPSAMRVVMNRVTRNLQRRYKIKTKFIRKHSGRFVVLTAAKNAASK